MTSGRIVGGAASAPDGQGLRVSRKAPPKLILDGHWFHTMTANAQAKSCVTKLGGTHELNHFWLNPLQHFHIAIVSDDLGADYWFWLSGSDNLGRITWLRPLSWTLRSHAWRSLVAINERVPFAWDTLGQLPLTSVLESCGGASGGLRFFTAPAGRKPTRRNTSKQ